MVDEYCFSGFPRQLYASRGTCYHCSLHIHGRWMYMERGSEALGGETYTEPATFKLLGLFYLNIDYKIK